MKKIIISYLYGVVLLKVNAKNVALFTINNH